MQDIKNKIEAVLFTVGRFVDLDELSQLTGIASKGVLNDALKNLIEDYEENSSNEIVIPIEGFTKSTVKRVLQYAQYGTNGIEEESKESLFDTLYFCEKYENDILEE